MFFALLFHILHSFSTKNQKMIALFHSSVTGLLALNYFPYLLSESTNIENTHAAGQFCATLTCQYMIYDLVNCKRLEYVFHHTLAIIASSYVIYTGKYETLVLYIELNEMSTIFLNLSCLNILKYTNELLFVITFVLCRIIWLPWVFVNKEVNGVLLYILYMHYMLQLFWLFKILKRVRKYA